jgi:transposase InsO family protein
VQVDVKFIAPIKGSRKKHYQFTAIDDCTRIRVLRIYDRMSQKTAIQFVDYVLEKLPFAVEVIQTDNGAEFQSQFHYHVLDRGIGHVYIKPATPRLNGKVERSHRIDAEEFYRMLEGVVIRRHRAVQRPAPGVGGLLQLQPSPWGTRGPDPV